VYHGKEKARGIRLTPNLYEALQSLADAQEIPIHEMACIILHHALKPDGRPLTDDEIYGKKKGV